MLHIKTGKKRIFNTETDYERETNTYLNRKERIVFNECWIARLKSLKTHTCSEKGNHLILLDRFNDWIWKRDCLIVENEISEDYISICAECHQKRLKNVHFTLHVIITKSVTNEYHLKWHLNKKRSSPWLFWFPCKSSPIL